MDTAASMLDNAWNIRAPVI